MSQQQAEYEASLLTVHTRLTFAPIRAILNTVHNHSMSFTTVIRTSNAVDYVNVDIFRGIARVAFANGYCYEYKNVSRRAIANLLCNANISLGFWVNANCVDADRTQVRYRYAYAV